MNAECESTATLLVEWADGDLTPRQIAQLEGHFQDCPACRRQRDDFLEMEGEIASYGRFVWQRQSGSLGTPGPRTMRRLAHWLPAAAAAVAAMVLLGVALLRPVPPPDEPETPGDRFVPIPYVPPLAPYEVARVVHMEVPVAALTAAGYRVQLTDPAAVVEADLLVGEDGRAHAVRLSEGALN